MNKTAFLGAAGALSLIAAPAFAQSVAGEVIVSGSVPSKCMVVDGASITTFSGSIALGELSGDDGTLKSDLTGLTVSGAEAKFRVHCTAAGATLAVEAEALENADVANAPADYARVVDFSADLVASLAGGGSQTVTDASANAGATSQVLTGAYLANAADNLVVKVHSLETEGGATRVLTAGAYAGKVKVTVTPAS